MRVGGTLINYRVREWTRTGRCTLESPAASGLVAEIQALPEWLEVDIFLQPFCQRMEIGQGDGEYIADPNAELFIGRAEHSRSVAIPQKGEAWRGNLPRTPLTTNELKELLLRRENRDERAALTVLANRGSTSAQKIHFLELTGELIREAFRVLRGNSRVQVSLARILGAARFKVLTQNKVFHVKCPKTYCFEKDSVQNMIQCYGLQEFVATGAEAVPFLVKMARVAMVPEGTKLIPYMVEYYPEGEHEGIMEEE